MTKSQKCAEKKMCTIRFMLFPTVWAVSRLTMKTGWVEKGRRERELVGGIEFGRDFKP